MVDFLHVGVGNAAAVEFLHDSHCGKHFHDLRQIFPVKSYISVGFCHRNADTVM